MDKENLRNRFTYHPPADDLARVKYQDIRTAGLSFADLIDDYLSECREKGIAIRKIEEAVMWANAGIARNGISR